MKAAVLGVLLAQRVAARCGMWTYALVSLPGTVAHEFAHYLAGVALLARPRFPSLWPVQTTDGWRLGSVSFHATVWRAVPIAMAPFLLMLLSLWWADEFLTPAMGHHFWVHAWIVGTLLNGSLPSRADFGLVVPAVLLTATTVISVAVWL